MPLPLLLALAVVTNAEPVKLAAPSLQAVGLDAAKATFLSDYLAQQIAGQGIRVTTGSEISALLGLERQRQLLSCSDASSNCMAELAGALGVEGVITGSIARTEGGSYAVAVKIINARDGSPLALASGRLKSEDAVLDFFTEQAPRLAADVRHALRGDEAPTVVASIKPPVVEDQAIQRTSSSKQWVPVAVGGGLAVAGVGLLALAQGDASSLRDGTASAESGEALSELIRGGQLKESVGVALLGAGVGAASAGAAMWGAPQRSRALLPIAGGGALAAGGVVFLALANGAATRIREGDPTITSPAQLSDAVRSGRTTELLGYGLLAAGLSAAGTGLGFYLLGAESAAQVSFQSSGLAHGITLSGSFE